MKKFLTLEGLQVLVEKLKTYFVKKEEGKGLSTNDLTDELKAKYDAMSGLDIDLSAYSTTEEMNTAIATAVADADHLKREVVDVLPDVADAKENVIYLVPKTQTKTKNVYDEYMLIKGEFELIGNTQVDLTGYLKEEDLVAITNEEIDAMFAD